MGTVGFELARCYYVLEVRSPSVCDLGFFVDGGLEGGWANVSG